jgi:small subunit ribosomal protein S6
LAVSADQRNEYELVLMLDPEAPDERRDQIATNARERIEGQGELKAERAWGMRKLAYEIRQRTEADYRFFRFETESPLLDELNHNLKITDGVLRFRIFKVDPRSPVIEPPPPVALASSASRGPGGPRRGGPPPEAQPATEQEAEAPAAAPAPEAAPAAVAEPVEPAPAEEPAPEPEQPPAED